MWCGEVWDVNWIYVYFWDYFLKIKLESNTVLIWPQGLSSACRSGSWLQRRWKHKQKGEAGQNDAVAMASQSWAWFWVLFRINEALWSVGRSSSVPPLTATVEKLVTAQLLSTSAQMRSSTALSEADCNFTCLKQSLLGAGRVKRKVRKKLYLFHICTVPAQQYGWLWLPAALE